jgi:hypothetical protein
MRADVRNAGIADGEKAVSGQPSAVSKTGACGTFRKHARASGSYALAFGAEADAIGKSKF